MILSKLSRQQGALQSCRASASTRRLYNPKAQRRRQLHHVPQLTHDEHFSKYGIGKAEGAGEMLTPDSYHYAWHEYQGYIVDCLNRMTAQTDDESRITKEILLKYARDPNYASLFNHASMAWNNHVFFSTLSPEPTEMSDFLTSKFNNAFGGVENLRATMIATANAMFGPGFVWLVKRESAGGDTYQKPDLAILTTYLAGSPLPGAHYRKQEHDTNTSLQAGVFGSRSANSSKYAPGGAGLEVMLCVNTWQHVWLRDWGFGGKKMFLERWWECIDWNVVERNGQFENATFRKKSVSFGLPRIGTARNY